MAVSVQTILAVDWLDGDIHRLRLPESPDEYVRVNMLDIWTANPDELNTTGLVSYASFMFFSSGEQGQNVLSDNFLGRVNINPVLITPTNAPGTDVSLFATKERVAMGFVCRVENLHMIIDRGAAATPIDALMAITYDVVKESELEAAQLAWGGGIML